MSTLESFNPTQITFDLRKWIFKKNKFWIFKICNKQTLRPLISLEKSLRPPFFSRKKISSPPYFFRKKVSTPIFFFEKESLNPPFDGPGPGTRQILTRPLPFQQAKYGAFSRLEKRNNIVEENVFLFKPAISIRHYSIAQNVCRLANLYTFFGKNPKIILSPKFDAENPWNLRKHN